MKKCKQLLIMFMLLTFAFDVTAIAQSGYPTSSPPEDSTTENPGSGMPPENMQSGENPAPSPEPGESPGPAEQIPPPTLNDFLNFIPDSYESPTARLSFGFELQPGGQEGKVRIQGNFSRVNVDPEGNGTLSVSFDVKYDNEKKKWVKSSFQMEGQDNRLIKAKSQGKPGDNLNTSTIDTTDVEIRYEDDVLGWRTRKSREIRNYSITDKITGQTLPALSDITYTYDAFERLVHKNGDILTQIKDGTRREYYDGPPLQGPIQVIIYTKSSGTVIADVESFVTYTDATKTVQYDYTYENSVLTHTSFFYIYTDTTIRAKSIIDDNGNRITLGVGEILIATSKIQRIEFNEPATPGGSYLAHVNYTDSLTNYKNKADIFEYFDGTITTTNNPVVYDVGVGIGTVLRALILD